MSRDWELKESKVWYILTRQAVDYLCNIKARGIRLPRALFVSMSYGAMLRFLQVHSARHLLCSRTHPELHL